MEIPLRLQERLRQFARPGFVFVSPWLLAAATALLVLIILTFALNNMQREKRLMAAALLQKAGTLMRVIHTGAKSSYIRDIHKGFLQPAPWLEHVQRVLEHVGDDPEIIFLAVVDSQNKVVASSQPSMIGTTMQPLSQSRLAKDTDTLEAPDGPARSAVPLLFRVQQPSRDRRVFVAERRFIPFQPDLPPGKTPFFQGPRHEFEPGPEPPPPPEIRSDSAEAPWYFLQVALDMRGYDASLKQLRFQLAMLSLVMLLVGVGGWLSLAAVQGFRGTRKVLREMQDFTALLVARMPVGIITTGPDGRITTWNSAVAAMLGIQEDSATGKPAQHLLPPPLAALLTPQPAELDDTAPGSRMDIVFDSGKGQHSVLAQQLPIRDREGAYCGQLLLLSDLTDLKNMEQQLREHERLAAIGRMAAWVAHEVRNPLSSVKGLALVLQNKFENGSRERESAGLLIQEVERMNRTIAELLSFAAPPKPLTETVDLPSLLERQLRLLENDLQTARITVDFSREGTIPPVPGDRERLGQVFLNIFLNSIQAMEQGGQVRILLQDDAAAGKLRITISDTGCGLDAEQQKQVFFPYFTTKSKGTGIGLALSQKIINDHNGSISFSAEPGKGATVTILLPRTFPE